MKYKHPLEETIGNVEWTVVSERNMPMAYVCDITIKKFGVPDECACSKSADGKAEYHVHKIGQSYYLIKKLDADILNMGGKSATGIVELFSEYYPLTEKVYFLLKASGSAHPSVRKIRMLLE